MLEHGTAPIEVEGRVSPMNFSSLSSNEKLATYGAIAAIVGVLIGSFVSGLGWLALLAGVAMLLIVFLPQMSSGTQLPGSKGSLMFAVGLIAGIAAALALLLVIGDLGAYLSIWPLQTLFLLLAVAGSLVMAYAGFQEFQREGGKFQFGGTGSGAAGGSSGSSAVGGGGGAGLGSGTGVGSSAGTSSPAGTSSAGMGTEGGMGTGSTGAPSGGAATGGAAPSTGGMGSAGAPSSSAGSTSAGSTDMGSGSGAMGGDEGTTRNP